MAEIEAQQAMVLAGTQHGNESLVKIERPEKHELNEGIIKQAWQNVMEEERAGQQPKLAAAPNESGDIDDKKFSAKVACYMAMDGSIEGKLVGSIYNNRHRVRELVKRFPKGEADQKVSYDKLFDYLINELWFPYFARAVSFSSEHRSYSGSANYWATAAKWVDNLMDLFLFDEVTDETKEKQFGVYVFHNSGGRYTMSHRDTVKNFLEGGGLSLGNNRDKSFSNLWEYLNQAVFPRSLQFKVMGDDGKMLTNSRGEQDLRGETEIKASENKLKAFREAAPAYIFRQCYFEKAKQALPKDKTIDLNSEEEVESFIHWVCNNFVHSLKVDATTAEGPKSALEERGFARLMPDFSKLEGVNAELKVLAMKNLFQTRVAEAMAEKDDGKVEGGVKLEAEFWEIMMRGKLLDDNFYKDIDAYLRKKWHHIFRSKKKIAAKYDRLEASLDAEEMATFVKYLFGLYTVAQVYAKSTDKEQQLQGKVYMEIVRLYGLQLEQTAVNLEARLKVPQFKPDDLSAAIFTVQSLMNRTVLTEQMKQLGEVETHIQVMGEAAGEVEAVVDAGADFDKRLAESSK